MMEGFKEIIIDARLAVINFKPEKKKKLYPAIPVILMEKTSKICLRSNLGNLPYVLVAIINNTTEANKKRRKAEVKGGRFADITLPAIKVLPKNKATKKSLT